jgi:hypothetical protein
VAVDGEPGVGAGRFAGDEDLVAADPPAVAEGTAAGAGVGVGAGGGAGAGRRLGVEGAGEDAQDEAAGGRGAAPFRRTAVGDRDLETLPREERGGRTMVSSPPTRVQVAAAPATSTASIVRPTKSRLKAQRGRVARAVISARPALIDPAATSRSSARS